ncbi:hypothetical protein VHEMI04666 [[Torrubiella] hemipterigena]|uniref:CYTH domain-containing protein n=1 Tax=[Torrubiella] hemipterigena TaxID=1531966 RepID=A0A0A1TEJ3_9HYPO|nr:hypothetical protein VHEMI04666 [[Torrubiella] hemipterigena]
MLPKAVLYLSLLFPVALAGDDFSLQWAICDHSPQHTLQKLGIDPSTPPYKENPITYYDELPPVYIHSGVMFRTKTHGGEPLSTIKVRFGQDTASAPSNGNCTWAQYGQNEPAYTCETRAWLDRSEPNHLWHDEQVEFVQRYKQVDWDALVPYGPYANAKWKLKIAGHKVTFDDVAAGNLHLMEIEVNVDKSHAHKVQKAITKRLKKAGVVLCKPQQGKTMRLFEDLGYLDDMAMEL